MVVNYLHVVWLAANIKASKGKIVICSESQEKHPNV